MVLVDMQERAFHLSYHPHGMDTDMEGTVEGLVEGLMNSEVRSDV